MTADLQLKSIADLISYVAKKTYEEEWKDIVAGAFPSRAPRAAADAIEAIESTPA